MGTARGLAVIFFRSLYIQGHLGLRFACLLQLLSHLARVCGTADFPKFRYRALDRHVQCRVQGLTPAQSSCRALAMHIDKNIRDDFSNAHN
jgi:hypothetical protein